MPGRLRERFVTPRVFTWARQNLPALSQTEREALERMRLAEPATLKDRLYKALLISALQSN